jgi:site-specific recombinase XerD
LKGYKALKNASPGRIWAIRVNVVQRLMGHSNIATTTRYLHLSDADLIEAIDRAFPAI